MAVSQSAIARPAPAPEPDHRTLRLNIFNMVWPVTIESVLHMAVGFVNTAMVGRLGATAIVAVGLSGRVSMIVWSIFSAIGTGATVLVARYYGANDISLARKTARQSLLAALVAIVLITGLAWLGAPQVLRIFRAPEETLNLGVTYLRLLVWAFPMISLVTVTGAILRGCGNTRTPMIIALTINIINMVGNWLLIFGRLGFPALGVRGSAIATITAHVVGAAFALFFLFSPLSRLAVPLVRKFDLDWPFVRRIIGIGLPTAMESLFWQAATVILLGLVNSFGTNASAAHQLGLQAEGLSYMPAAGFSIAAMALVGQSLGARNARLAEHYVREITRWAVILTVITASILFFFPNLVMGILTTDREVIELGAKYLMLMALAQLPQQVAGVLNGTLRGAGDTRTPMLIAGGGIWVIRLPLAFFFARWVGMGITGVWLAMTLDLFIRFGIVLWRYRLGHWKNIQLD